MSLDLTVHADLEGRVRLGILVLDGVVVREQDEALRAEIEATGRELRGRFGGASSGEVPETAEARILYKALGIDPTKTRPSNEALLRRVLKGEALFRVNALVDALNLASLRVQLPFGLYDLGRVEPPIVLRKGGTGESYEGIRKGVVNVEARPVMVDARGPFGNPTSDSARTMITLDTRSALVIAYAPAATTPARLNLVLDVTESLLTGHCGGTCTERRLL
ncbi:MAG TPA: phenylalanine--tRNA ligase beta subunit-related protein [Vicinamibacteria bacterium]|nr:phenylalanine--tRNA ligase beta subunit-related protein [Vicinamibacteria bacterium]